MTVCAQRASMCSSSAWRPCKPLQAGSTKRELCKNHCVRRARLDVQLRRVAPLWLDEDLVPLLLREAHDLVLDRGAVSRPRGLHPAAVLRRLVQVLPYQIVRRGVGVRQIARHLLALNVPRGVERKPARDVVAGLRLHDGEVDGVAVDAGGCAGLEAASLKAKALQVLCEPH